MSDHSSESTKNPVTYPNDNSKVMRIMAPHLDQQAAIAFYEEETTVVNTTRVVLFEPANFSSSWHAKEFACGEFLQNPSDFMKPALIDNECTGTHTDDGRTISWCIDGVCVLSLCLTDRGFDITQVGLPLSLNCIGTGTGSKRNSTIDPAAFAGGEQACTAGGFGDGSKTAFHALLYYGYNSTYVFYCFDSNDMDRVIEWRCISRVFKGFTDPHMAIEVVARRRTDDERKFTTPTMITRVSANEPGNDVESVQTAFVRALSRFQRLMYDVRPVCTVAISAPGFGAWRHACTYVPKFDHLGKYPIELPCKPNCCLVLVGGIFYQAECIYMPQTLVIEVFGNGIPKSPMQVFTSQMRVISIAHLSSVFRIQFIEFHKIKENHERITNAFLPLLYGGSSFLVMRNIHNVVQQMLYSPDICKTIRNMLLFRFLSPRCWGVSEKAERKVVWQRVNDAVLCHDTNSDRVRWYQYLRGKSGNVVVIDPYKANYQLFSPVDLNRMEADAAKDVLCDAKKKQRISELLETELRPAIKYISSGEPVQVVRVTKAAGDGIPAYNFRANMDKSIIVIYQSEDDPEHTVKSIQPHMHDTDLECSRAHEFCMHFFGNLARRMCLKDRVKHAISCAKNIAPYDLGDEKLTLKRAREESSSDSDSESDDPLAFAKQRFKVESVAGKGKGKASSSRSPMSNLPRDKVPTIKTLPKNMCGVGGDGSRPAPDVGDSEMCSLEWNAAHNVFMPSSGSLGDIPSNLPRTIEKFCRSVDLVRAQVDVGRCQFFPSYAPLERWAGFHRNDGMCIINLAFKTEAGGIIGTMLHELAHEASSYHDIDHGHTMQTLFEQMTSHMLPF